MNKNKLKSVIFNPVISFLIILPYIKPASELTGSYDQIFDIMKFLFFPVILWSYFKYAKLKPRLSIFVLIFQIILLLSTFISHGDIRSALTQLLSNFGCCMYFETLISVDYHLAIKRIAFPLILFAIITSITMFLCYPNGLYQVYHTAANRYETSNYFWGFDNSSIFRFIPAMLCLGLYSYDKNKKKVYFFSLLIMIFISCSFIYVDSITASIFCIFITISFYLIRIRNIKMLDFKKSLIIIFVIFILLALFNENLVYLWQFATEHNKYYSIKARFIFWERIFDYIKFKPIFGYGIEDRSITFLRLGIDHPHNFFMDIIYRSGIIGCFCIGIYLLQFFKLKYNKKNKNCAFSVICFFSIMIVAQMDFYNVQYLFYSSLLICYYTNLLSTHNKEDFLNEKNRNINIPTYR